MILAKWFTILENNNSNAQLLSVTPDLNKSKEQSNKVSFVGVSILFVLLAGAFFLLRKKRKKPLNNPNLISLGQFYFDTRNTTLLFENQEIELTSKEADLLLLLFKDVNTTIEREVILNMVWGDEGDYVGRTLDVFISKLRKKLEWDSQVKIVNIRGIGYKLVVNV